MLALALLHVILGTVFLSSCIAAIIGTLALAETWKENRKRHD